MTADASLANARAERHARSRWGVPIVWLGSLAMAGIGLLLAARSGWSTAAGGYGFPGFTALFAVTYGSVGALVLWRKPANRVGQVLLAAGALEGLQTLYTEYAVVGVITAPGSLPLATVAAWLVAWAWVPFVFLAGPVLLSIFPDGRFLSSRWRLLLVVVGIGAVGFIGSVAFRVGPLENFVATSNPFGLIPRDQANALANAFLPSQVAGIVLAVASLVIRYRRTDSERRQQLKWLALAGVFLGIVAPLGFNAAKTWQVAFIVAMCGIPVATGVAVLRYGLYEIDLIINRAIVYALLTAILAGLYAAVVGVSQQAFRAATGSSDGAVVVSTLLVVTAFTPVKNALQSAVDSRFREADPVARLARFRAQLTGRIYTLDPERTLATALELICAAVDSRGGRAELVRGDGSVQVSWGATIDDRAENLEWTASAASRGVSATVRFTMAPREHPRALSERDRAGIRDTLDLLAAQLATFHESS